MMLRELWRQFAATLALVGLLVGALAPLATPTTLGGAALVAVALAPVPAAAEAVLRGGNDGTIVCRVNGTVGVVHYTWANGGSGDCPVELPGWVAQDLAQTLTLAFAQQGAPKRLNGVAGVYCPRHSICANGVEGPGGVRASIAFTAFKRDGHILVVLDPWGPNKTSARGLPCWGFKLQGHSRRSC